MPQAPQASAAPCPTPAGWHPPSPSVALPGVSPGDAGWVFIDRMDEWRRAMGWSHKDFAHYLGIAESYWRAMRTHQKELTISVAHRVLEERPELGFILGDPAKYFYERSKRRKRRTPSGRNARGLAADLAHALLPFLAAAAALADVV